MQIIGAELFVKALLAETGRFMEKRASSDCLAGYAVRNNTAGDHQGNQSGI